MWLPHTLGRWWHLIQNVMGWREEGKQDLLFSTLGWEEMGLGSLTAVFQMWGGGCLLSALVRNGGWWLLVSVGFLDTGFSRFLELIHMASSFQEEKEDRSGFQVKGLLGWKKKNWQMRCMGSSELPCVRACVHTHSHSYLQLQNYLTALLIAVGLSGATHRLPGYAWGPS